MIGFISKISIETFCSHGICFSISYNGLHLVFGFSHDTQGGIAVKWSNSYHMYGCPRCHLCIYNCCDKKCISNDPLLMTSFYGLGLSIKMVTQERVRRTDGSNVIFLLSLNDSLILHENL